MLWSKLAEFEISKSGALFEGGIAVEVLYKAVLSSLFLSIEISLMLVYLVGEIFWLSLLYNAIESSI